ncbi:MAG: PorP/SprF family type IX secretion system membrane protein [Saprospiraceae bacterium]|nr:PorP/SprF family type IX secretion system membrane protein [Saprospiraceae bacterium]
MTRSILSFVLVLTLPLCLAAQQLPLPGMIRTTDYLWNPAMAGHPGEWGAHANYQQSWLGFDGAPVTALVGGAVNMKKFNMALAGDILFDQTGPLRFTGISVAYKYQFNPGLLDDDDRFSIGLLGTLGQRRYDASQAKVSDQIDPLLTSDAGSQFDFNAGAGILYRTVADDDLDKSHFFVGVAASQLIPTNLSFNDASPYGNRIHGNAVLGWRTARYLYFDHTLWLNYADAKLFNLGYQFRIENPDAFWAGLNLNSSLNFGLESGVILDGSWANADQFRIGALASYNIGANGSNQGFSFAANFELVKLF